MIAIVLETQCGIAGNSAGTAAPATTLCLWPECCSQQRPKLQKHLPVPAWGIGALRCPPWTTKCRCATAPAAQRTSWIQHYEAWHALHIKAQHLYREGVWAILDGAIYMGMDTSGANRTSLLALMCATCSELEYFCRAASMSGARLLHNRHVGDENTSKQCCRAASACASLASASVCCRCDPGIWLWAAQAKIAP